MQAVAHRSFNPLAVLFLAGPAVAAILLSPAAYQPYVMAALLAAIAVVLTAFYADMVWLLLAALLATVLLGGDVWRLDLPGWPNLTIDRLVLAGVVAAFGVGLLAGRWKVHIPPVLGPLLAALLLWVAIATQHSGWTLAPFFTEKLHLVPPYYQYYAGFLAPFVLFLLAMSVFRGPRDLGTLLVCFSLFGLYLTVVGLAAKYGADFLVWPRVILDKAVGIHYGRVRGPFLNGPDMGMMLTICFFANLLLASHANRALGLLLILISLPMPFLIYFTLTRSIWIAFLLAVVIAVWFWPRSRRISVVLSCLLLASLLVLAAVFWSNITSSRREQGGVADAAPAISRIQQTYIAMEIIRSHPLRGVGLGHYPVEAYHTQTMTAIGSAAYTYARGAVEHNNFISLLAETGLPGVLLYAGVTFGLLIVSIRLYRMIPNMALGYLDRRFIVFYWIVWVVFFTNSSFRLTTDAPFPNCMFLLTGALIVACWHALRPQPVRLPPLPRVLPARPRPVAAR
ncbi:MAG: hypothetical protein BIFFINMI_03683 [Phycisphaerae bacterium]|nr:hypothetical protein [Phycisphaerae bacterium]